ncbi:MAG: DNA-binding protein [Solobacterium sp.]|nr:DNA-binding protein [Solobacterium sp.]
MSDKFEYNELLDHYGGLLTPRQQTIANDYFREDLSLQEIAELEGISRAAVYDMIKRCREDLERYEEILHDTAQSRKRRILYARIAEEGNETIRRYIEECLDTEGGEYD